MFCLEESKKIQRLDKTHRGKELYSTIKSCIHIVKDMRRDFDRGHTANHVKGIQQQQKDEVRIR